MKKTLALIAAALLSACGGGSSSSPPDPFANATPITPGTPVVGTISSDTEYDAYAFTVPAGGATVHFQTFDEGGTACDPVNGRVDTTVEVFDASRTSLWYEDDSLSVPSAQPWCEDFSVPLAAGTHFAVVGGWGPFPFNYTLRIEIL